MKKLIAVVAFSCMGLMSQGMANELPAHGQAKPSETLEQAVVNLSETNQKLAAVLKQPMNADTMHEAHMLSYTLEVALQKISDELARAAEALEEMHLASERLDDGGVLLHGGDYLSITGKVVK